ncbi:MAG: flagellar export protein FliJ [Lachnospiraceae bacterium]|nr:flagellar export protein FliJ [Lachnospiraceae bacterium]
MAVYKYKMQGILDIKEKLETQAKQEFANANLRLLEEEALLDSIRKKKESYIEEGVSLRMQTIDPVSIDINKRAVEVMEDAEKKQEREVAVARKNVDAARRKMMEARMETKIYEKLKEDDFKEFMTEEGKAESKEIDELNSFRFSERARRGDK